MATHLEVLAKTALEAGVSTVQAKRVLDGYFDEVIRKLKQGDIIYSPIGSFYVGKSIARNGRNPRTGATILIRAKNRPKLRFNQLVIDAVN